MKPSYILIAGGAGYIGSHINQMLNLAGYATIVYDNLSKGSRSLVQQGLFVEGDIGDASKLDSLMSQYPIQAVMHFAAYIDVGESVKNPALYYLNNVSKTLVLLDAMNRHRIYPLIFSSSAAVYGNPEKDFLYETDPCHPINPYGHTKLMVETILKDYSAAYGLRSCSLRYFNAAGGDPRGRLKYKQKKISHLIPLLLRSLISPDHPVTIYGGDYPTHDGTCIRDYIHLEDLGRAHILALERLLSGGETCCYNVGNGKGYSVQEVVRAVEAVTGIPATTRMGDRRAGDPPRLVANAEKIERELGWSPQYPDIQTMIEHAWKAFNP